MIFDTPDRPKGVVHMRGVVLSLRAIYEVGVISVPTVVESMVGRVTREKCDARLEVMSRNVLAQAGVRLEVTGREHLATAERFVVMSNHLGTYDIPVLFQVFVGRSVRMVAKEELMRIPVWGQAMRASGFISVDRKQPRKALESLEQAGQRLDPEVDVWIAPEGTRSRTKELLPFKKGGFRLAVKTKRRILPIFIRGTDTIVPADSYVIRTGARVDVQIGAPIETAPFGGDVAGLTTHVRSWFLAKGVDA
jgi:1-acyl-sn-glycerol-3-phosphate acyltransferase